MSEQREGYRFDGWFADEERTKRLNPGGRLPETVTFYDKWVPIVYPVEYELNGGTNDEMNPNSITIESGLVKLYPAYKSGKVFKGWKWKGEFINWLPETLHEDVHLEAVFTDRPFIEFETGCTSKIPSVHTNDLGMLPEIRKPIRIGYDFTGWFRDEDETEPVDITKPVYESGRLHAGWKLTEYPVHYDLGGGKFTNTPRVFFSVDTPTWFLPKPVRSGYKFRGWKDSRGNVIRSVIKGSIGEKKLSALWESDVPEIHSMKDYLASRENESGAK